MTLRPASRPFFAKTSDQQPLSACGRGFRKQALALAGVIAIGSLTSPALAESEPSTKLVRCGAQSCLQVSGYRSDPSATVRLNGQAVDVEGKYGWEVSLPVETVRSLSAPYARSIEVSVHNPETEQVTSANADLPIGLLGGVTDLASLEVRAP